MVSSRPQTIIEVDCIEDENEKRGAMSSAKKHARQQKRKKAGTPKENNEETRAVAKKVRTRRQDQKSEELFGGKIREGTDCCNESEIQRLQPSEKIKLQLFPINESTRLRLETDGYNPFLELTLSSKKRIWSVIKHINTKWGNENDKLGKALLFPYDVNMEKLASYRRWSMEDTEISAREVYMSVNCPAVFRLRYGWFLDHQLEVFKMPLLSTHSDCRRQSEVNNQALDIQANQMKEPEIEYKCSEKVVTTNKASDVVNEQMPSVEQVECVGNQMKGDGIHDQLVPWEDNLTNLSIGGLISEVSLLGKIIKSDTESASQMHPFLAVSDFSVGGLLSEVSLQGKIYSGDLNSVKELDRQPLQLVSGVNTGCSIPQQFPWDDSITALSIGGLLSEASRQAKINNFDPNLCGNKPSLPHSEESLGAFVATQLNSHFPDSKSPLVESRTSFFDAEETCHAFPIRKVSPSSGMAATATEAASSKECQEGVSLKSEATAEDDGVQQSKTNFLPSSQGNLDEDSCSLGLKGIKWNESLGPFDLGQPVWSSLTVGDSISVSQFVK